MKRRELQADIVTEKRGFFGKIKQSVRHRTVTLSDNKYQRLKNEQWKKNQKNRELSERERLAALYLAWEEEFEEQEESV